MKQTNKYSQDWEEERTCPVCGKKFFVKRETKSKKYCSKACRDAIIRLQQIEYRRRKRAQEKEQKQEYEKITKKEPKQSLIRLWADSWKNGTTTLQYGEWVVDFTNSRPRVEIIEERKI